MPVDPPRMRRGEHFLGRDVGVAGDAVLGGRGAALPFMAVGQANGEVGAGPRIFQGAEALAVQPFGAAAQRGIVAFPGRNGAVIVDARSRKDRVRQFGHRDVLFVVRERPASPRTGSDRR